MFYSRQKNSNIHLLLITQQMHGNLKIAALRNSILATVGLTQQERFSAIFLQIFRHQVFHLWLPKTMIGLPKVFTENSDSMTLLKLDGFKCTVSRGMDTFSIQTNASRKVAISISTCMAAAGRESTSAYTCSLVNMLLAMTLLWSILRLKDGLNAMIPMGILGMILLRMKGSNPNSIKQSSTN